MANVRFGEFQSSERLPEVLATGDVHVVALKAGLGRVSVPSKTYSILAAGRPVVASIDPGTEVPRILDAAEAGTAVAPDDPDAFCAALASCWPTTTGAAPPGSRADAGWRSGCRRPPSPSSTSSCSSDCDRSEPTVSHPRR
ncbi:MAG: glycosyltransferase [Ilumatobacteraceae bacterium]